MTPMKFVRNVLVALTGQTAPSELAGAVAMGMLIALIPKGNLLAHLLVLSLFLMRVNFALAAASTALFLLVTPLTDRLADALGYLLLVRAETLKPLWTWLYNRPLLPWTGFNNTLVLGNLVLGLALYVPLYLLVKKGIALYQARLKDTVLKWKVVQMVKTSYLLRWLFPDVI